MYKYFSGRKGAHELGSHLSLEEQNYKTSNNMNDFNTFGFRCDTVDDRAHEGVFCPLKREPKVYQVDPCISRHQNFLKKECNNTPKLSSRL